MRLSRVIRVSSLLLILALAGCGAGLGAPATPPPAAVKGAAVPTAAAATPAAATVSPAVPADGGVKPAASPAAAAADTAPPVVSLSADQTEIPWLESTTITVTAQDNVGVVNQEVLLRDQVLATASDSDLTFDLIPAALDGVSPGSTYTLTARAVDAAGNVGQAALAVEFGPLLDTPTPDAAANLSATAAASEAGTPAPKVTPAPTRPGGEVSYRVTEITLPTYPYAAYLRQTTDPNLGDYPVTVLDHVAYEAANPQPVPKKHRLIVLENRYLRLGILPDLGGRIYEATFKPTGNNEFYSNPVVKPTNWGPANPTGANWWLATGGVGWDFPVEEHGYEFGTAWGFDHVTLPNGGVMLTLFTRHGPQLPYAVVDVILPPDAAYFVVQPRITNPWGAPFKFKWWDNAMLAPGAANSPGPGLQFIFPASEVTVHSTGDATLPAAGQPMTWPVYGGRDFSQLKNWTEYLGVFQRPAATGNVMGVYDTAADEGMLRVYPSDVARGVMVFAPGWSDPLDAERWTDDGSGFVAMGGGMTPSVEDWYELAPGADISWSEIWYPVAGISGVTYAAENGAIHLLPGGSGLRVGVFPIVAVQGQLTVSLPGMEPVMWPVAVGPDKPFDQQVPYTANMPDRGNVAVTLTDSEDLVGVDSTKQRCSFAKSVSRKATTQLALVHSSQRQKQVVAERFDGAAHFSTEILIAIVRSPRLFLAIKR